jgi:GlpG protein
MRLIGTLHNEDSALTFSRFLGRKGIAHQIEAGQNTDWGSAAYGSYQCQIWIHDEEQFQEASNWLHLYQEHPKDPLFAEAAPFSGPEAPPLPLKAQPAGKRPASASWEKRPLGPTTRALLALCVILFFLSHLLTPTLKVPERYTGLILFASPIEKALLFDYPKLYSLLDEFLHQYGYEQLENPADLPPEGEHLLDEINEASLWPGFYHLLLKGGIQAAKSGLYDYPTFEKIREGQVWRLFTPCLLHADIFHIFFNMLWLIVLGKQIEQRLSPARYLLFIGVIGVVSNTAQYLTSGPNFIGFSGVLCGMLAFIWMRQKRAAWEGYQIDRLTLIFMLMFILGMAGIQIFSFILEKSYSLAYSPNIANMAHLTGGAMGFWFGRMNFFSWRIR